jgi:hypothetical protein
MSGLSLPVNHEIVALLMDLEGFEWTRRWT